MLSYLFHTDPLELETTHSLVEAVVLCPDLLLDIFLQQSLIHIPMNNNPSAPLTYTQANDSIGTAPIIANTTHSDITVPSVQAIEQTIPTTQADQLTRLSHPGGGIFCANIGCTLKGGNCTCAQKK